MRLAAAAGRPDRIILEGVRCRARLGVPDRERKRPQLVRLDIELELPLKGAGTSDDVRLTADYAAVESLARAVSARGEYRLAERLALELCRAVLKAQPRVRAVTVRVRKRPAAMPATREVVVETSLRREAPSRNTRRRRTGSPRGARRPRTGLGSARGGG